MTKGHDYNALQKREDCMTKVTKSFQSSDLNALNAMLLRGEVDPWETLSLNNPLFHWAWENAVSQNSVFPYGFQYFSSEYCVLPCSQRVSHQAAAPVFWDPGGTLKSIKK